MVRMFAHTFILYTISILIMKNITYKIDIINKSHHPLPSYKSKMAAGMDLTAFLPKDSLQLMPRIPTLIPTGIYLALPAGLEGQVRARSGLAARHGIIVPNAPGTIDPDYRGEIKVILMNLSNTPFEIKDGDRIAQLVIASYISVQWEVREELNQTERGKKGFGSTGIGD